MRPHMRHAYMPHICMFTHISCGTLHTSDVYFFTHISCGTSHTSDARPRFSSRLRWTQKR